MTKSAGDLFLEKALKKREENGLLRTLKVKTNLVDFCSNDYLGFSQSDELKQLIKADDSHLPIGSTGSRLISGNSEYIEGLERYIASYHNAPAGLIYNSGYDANAGLFSCIAQRSDTVLYDEYIHASVRDGLRIGLAKSNSFRHNDLEHLETLLKKASGQVFVVVESVYSMDGDFAPLKEMADLCSKYEAHLIVDEAHATGIYGKKGEGRVCELKLEGKTFARIHTFGKALGCHGAIVLGSPKLREFLINFSRPFIYTTALPFYELKCVKNAYDFLSKSNNKILIINNLIELFIQKVESIKNICLIPSKSPIQCIIISGNNEVKKLSVKIQESGFDVRPILSPTIVKGKERLRICLHAFNSEKEIEGLVNSISSNIFKL